MAGCAKRNSIHPRPAVEHLLGWLEHVVGRDAIVGALVTERRRRQEQRALHQFQLGADLVVNGLFRRGVAEAAAVADAAQANRSEEHTSELPSLMRISYAVSCLKKKIHHTHTH